MASIMHLLWKMSLNEKCRLAMEQQGVVNDVLQLLTYKSKERKLGQRDMINDLIDRVISYSVGTLCELWECPALRSQLKNQAVPEYLQLLKSSLNSLTLAHVCTALGRATTDSDCMSMIIESNGFLLVHVLLPSLEVHRFDKCDDFYEPETIIAVANCLTMMIVNNPVRTIIAAYLYVNQLRIYGGGG